MNEQAGGSRGWWEWQQMCAQQLCNAALLSGPGSSSMASRATTGCTKQLIPACTPPSPPRQGAASMRPHRWGRPCRSRALCSSRHPGRMCSAAQRWRCRSGSRHLACPNRAGTGLPGWQGVQKGRQLASGFVKMQGSMIRGGQWPPTESRPGMLARHSVPNRPAHAGTHLRCTRWALLNPLRTPCPPDCSRAHGSQCVNHCTPRHGTQRCCFKTLMPSPRRRQHAALSCARQRVPRIALRGTAHQGRQPSTTSESSYEPAGQLLEGLVGKPTACPPVTLAVPVQTCKSAHGSASTRAYAQWHKGPHL